MVFLSEKSIVLNLMNYVMEEKLHNSIVGL